MRSPWGRVLKSIREDEDAARSLGKNVVSYKMQSLVLGGVIGALGGLSSPSATSRPSRELRHDADVLRLHDPHPRRLGRVKGPIVGAMIFWFVIPFVDNVLAEAVRTTRCPGWLAQSTDNFGQVKFIVAGSMLALLVIFRPQGIFGDRREQVFDVR